MTHFDFKTLLPALLAGRRPREHGARVGIARAVAGSSAVEFAATIPANVKFKDGTMKHVLKIAFAFCRLSIWDRQTRWDFPRPTARMDCGEATREFVHDILSSPARHGRARHR